jgi:hypothetical protein
MVARPVAAAPLAADPPDEAADEAAEVADPAAELAADAAEVAALVALLAVLLLPDEQAASARPAAASPAMSFRLRARRTCVLLFFMRITRMGTAMT